MKKEQKIFNRALFGYNRKDVQAYLDGVIEKISALSLKFHEREAELLRQKGELENREAALLRENDGLLTEAKRQEKELAAAAFRLQEAEKQREDLEKQLKEQAFAAKEAEEKLRELQSMQDKVLAASSFCKSVLGVIGQNCQSMKEDLEQMENSLSGASGEAGAKTVLPFKEKIV